MHVGVVLPQVGADWDYVLEAARHAEDNGADSIWVIDHVLGFPAERGILEAWTLMSALAAVTDRVEIGAQVHCQSFRNPALMAKMTATLDRVAKGRLRMLMGAGWYEAEYQQYGWEFPPPGVRIEQLRETIQILRGLLGPHESFTFEGKHYRTNGATNMPLPVQQPFPIEIGGAQDRLVRTVAMMGDGFNCPGAALAALENRLELLKTEMEKRGRSMDELRLSCQIVAAVGDDDVANDPRMMMFNPQLGLVGDAKQAAERAKHLMSVGVTDFNCIVPPGAKGRAIVERVINEVKPLV